MARLPVRTPDEITRAIDRLRRKVLHNSGFSGEEIETLGDGRVRELTNELVKRHPRARLMDWSKEIGPLQPEDFRDLTHMTQSTQSKASVALAQWWQNNPPK